MTTPAREFSGHIQAGGEASGAPWTEATFLSVDDDVAILVNQTEVARITSPTITDTGNNDVFLIEGADEPLFFRPSDPGAFRAAVLPPQTTAEKIAAATAAGAAAQDATMVMDTVPEPEPGVDGVGDADAEEEASNSRLWWVLAAVAGLLIILLVAFCGGEEGATSTTTTVVTSTTSSPATTTTTVAGTTTTAAATTTTAAATTTSAGSTTTTAGATTTTAALPDPAFGAGTHSVGDDVQPGVYETGMIVGPFGCYWERLSGLSGELDDIIANGNVAGHDVVEIIDGDVAFGTDCDAWYDLTQRDPLLTTVPEGKWALNTHISPGTYEAPGSDTCYWERLSGLTGTPDDVIANDLPQGSAIVEIDPSDVAFNSIGCGEWTPA